MRGPARIVLVLAAVTGGTSPFLSHLPHVSHALAQAARPSRAPAAECTRTDAARVGTGDLAGSEDLRDGAFFRCTLRPGGPARRVVLLANSGSEPRSLRIEGGGRTQVFALGEANTAPSARSRFFRALDLNRDGWADLMVLASSGAQGQEWYEVFRYVPARRRFVRDDTLSGAGNTERVPGRPCVTTQAYYIYKLIREEQCWRGGGWRLVREERIEDLPAPGTAVRTVRALRAGRMRVVSVDTLREGGR